MNIRAKSFFVLAAIALVVACDGSQKDLPPTAEPETPPGAAPASRPASGQGEWPSFRGPSASGVADGQGGFGYIVFLRSEDIDRAASVLGI